MTFGFLLSAGLGGCLTSLESLATTGLTTGSFPLTGALGLVTFLGSLTLVSFLSVAGSLISFSPLRAVLDF